MTYVNGDDSLLDYHSLRWTSAMCGSDIVCGACPDEPTGGTCSPEGVCVDIVDESEP